jgi:effector-binding domain-containing protein
MLYGQLYQGLRGLGITPLQPEITLYHNEDYVETDLDVEVSVPVHPKYQKQELPDDIITLRKLPAHELAATVIYEGRYEEMMPAILSLLRWIGVSDHVPAGPLRELHLSGPAHVGGEVVDSAVIEFQVPIQMVNV